MASDPAYAELVAATAFSFLRGASRPEEMAAQAATLGLAALGVADINTVAGVVRAHEAARQVDLRLLVGCRLAFRDGTPDLIAYPTDRAAWGRLTRLLTLGKRRATKGQCHLDRGDLVAHSGGLLLLAMLPFGEVSAHMPVLRDLRRVAHDRLYLCLCCHRGHEDDDWLDALADMARRLRIKPVATNDALYHAPERRPLHEAMTAIRLGRTIDTLGTEAPGNAERHLKPPQEMARLFASFPEAVANTMEVVGRCDFALTDLAYEYPDEPLPPGKTPDDHLADLVRSGAAWRYPQGVPPKIAATLREELAIIRRLDYARYFLTVHDIVQFARSQGILCQGRGSAANSAICYVLGITAVDPTEIDLLFSRFISTERREPPDIDVDFEHERREDVIQYVYRRYGADRAGIAATVIHYRPKLAIREIGKALGLSQDVIGALSAQTWAAKGQLWTEDRLREAGIDVDAPGVTRAVALARELVGFPRHLSQHVGGFVLTRGPLTETVPLGPAAMKERSFIEWDKDDIDTLGIMKIDILALGMLTCIRKCLDLLRGSGVPVGDMADIPRDDPAVWRMLQRGDTIGVFQVESRAQMNMLPRLKPKCFYDLVMEVAIVRPGPIQGDMVHPYLRRRQGLEGVEFPAPSPEHGDPDELERVLGRTLGVPLFQEQAMRIAIEAARFTPEEANALRRAMATFRNVGTIQTFFDKMVDGMVARGYDRGFAERCFRQIEGFGTYGFPESHAASFAYLVYVSSWLKCRHPAAFACALLNAQPMGFYAPAQIVRDARDHGVVVRAPDVGVVGWDCVLEDGGALRLGLRTIGGFREEWAECLARARCGEALDLAALRRLLPAAALLLLADADAMRSLGLDRRAALWHARDRTRDEELPLAFPNPPPVAPPLPPITLAEHVVTDYRSIGLSLKSHPMHFLRAGLAAEGVMSCAEATAQGHDAKVVLAGIVLVRQRPGSAEGVVFATIEDETGIANIVVWPALTERYRREVVGASLLLVRGQIQRSREGIVHVVTAHLQDRSADLQRLDAASLTPVLARADEVARPQMPRSRDFR